MQHIEYELPVAGEYLLKLGASAKKVGDQPAQAEVKFDGQPLVGVPAFKGAVGVYDVKSGKEIRKIETDNTTYSLAISPDGKTLVAGSGQRRFSQLIEMVAVSAPTSIVG